MGSISVGWSFVPLDILVTVISSGVVTIYAGLCIAALVGRRTGSTAHAAWRMPLFPLAPLVTLAVLGGVIWTSLMDVKVGRPGLLANAGVIILWVLIYRFVVRPRGAWRHRGPSEAVVEP
jgi:L-asparagine transporter-like permease